MAHPNDEFLVQSEDLDDAVALAARSLRKIAGRGNRGGRYVRTPEGANFYGQPIGTLITADVVAAAERKHGKRAPKNALSYNPVPNGRSASATGSRQSAMGNHLKDGPHPIEPANKGQAAASKTAATPRDPSKPGSQGAVKRDYSNIKAMSIKDKSAVAPETENYDLDGTPIELPKGSRVIRRSNDNVMYARTPDGGVRAYKGDKVIDLGGNQDAIKDINRLFDADLGAHPDYREEAPVAKDSSNEIDPEIKDKLDDVAAKLDAVIQTAPPEQRAKLEEIRSSLDSIDADGSDADFENWKVNNDSTLREQFSSERGETPNPTDQKQSDRLAATPDGTPTPAQPAAASAPADPNAPEGPKTGDKFDADSMRAAKPGSMISSTDPVDNSVNRYTKRDDGMWYKRGHTDGYTEDDLDGEEGTFTSVPDEVTTADAPTANAPEADAAEADTETVDFDRKAIKSVQNSRKGEEGGVWEKINNLDADNDETELDLTPDEMQEFLDGSQGDNDLADARNAVSEAKKTIDSRATSTESTGDGENGGPALVQSFDEVDGAQPGDVFAVEQSDPAKRPYYYTVQDDGSMMSSVTGKASAKEGLRVPAENDRLYKVDTVGADIPPRPTLEDNPEGFRDRATRRRDRYDKRIADFDKENKSAERDDNGDLVDKDLAKKSKRFADARDESDQHVKSADEAISAKTAAPEPKKKNSKRAKMGGVNDGTVKGNPILDLPEGDGKGDTPDTDFLPKAKDSKTKLGKPGEGKRGRKTVPGFEETEGTPSSEPDAETKGTPSSDGNGPATSFDDQDFHPDAPGDPNGVAPPEVTAEGHSWSLTEGEGATKEWLDNVPAGSEFTIEGGKTGREWGTFRKDVDGSWRRIDGRLGHFNPRTEGLQGNWDAGHNFNMFNDRGELTGDYETATVSRLGDADYRPPHVSKSYEPILSRSKDLEAMPDGVSVVIYDPANSLRVNNVPKYSQYYKRDGKWFAVTSDGMVTEGLDSDRLGIEGRFLYKSGKGDDTSVIPSGGKINPGDISPRARYYARDIRDGEFSEGSVAWRIRTDKETNTTGQKTYAYRQVGTNEDGEDLWIGQDFATRVPLTTDQLNRTLGGEFFVDDTPATIGQYVDRKGRSGGLRGHYLEDNDLSPLVNHYEADVPAHMDYFAGDNVKQFSQLSQFPEGSVVRVVGKPGEQDSYMRKEQDGWHRMTGPDSSSPEVVELTSNTDAYQAFKDRNRGVKFESFGGSYDKDDEGIDLTPDGFTASVGEVQGALGAIDGYEGHHFATAAKQIPKDNILSSPEVMDAVLKRARLAHPGVSDKEAVSRYLRSLVNQRRANFSEGDSSGAKTTIGDKTTPSAGKAKGTEVSGDFTQDEIGDAIDLLEASNSSNARSILSAANNPLAKIDHGKALRDKYTAAELGEMNREQKKQAYIDYLKDKYAEFDEEGLGGVNEGKDAGNVSTVEESAPSEGTTALPKRSEPTPDGGGVASYDRDQVLGDIATAVDNSQVQAALQKVFPDAKITFSRGQTPADYKDHVSALVRVSDKYPVDYRGIKEIKINREPTSGAFASVAQQIQPNSEDIMYDANGNPYTIIKINTARTFQEYRDSRDNGHFFVDDDVNWADYLLTHEWGHVLNTAKGKEAEDDILATALSLEVADYRSLMRQRNELVSQSAVLEYMFDHGVGLQTAMTAIRAKVRKFDTNLFKRADLNPGEVSAYALSSVRELVAEAFATMETSPHMGTPIYRRIHDRILKYSPKREG